MKTYSRVYAKIDLDALLHNVEEMQAILPAGTRILGIIKTDAYGHGAGPIGKLLENLEVTWGYGVATVEEGIQLRKEGLQKPILVLGTTFPEQYGCLGEYDLSPTIFSLEAARDLSEALKEREEPLGIHIKLDTGLSRLGFAPTEESVEDIVQIAALPHLKLEGLFSHYATADGADKTKSHSQELLFFEMRRLLEERGITFSYYHMANSAGIIDLPNGKNNLVRAGISLYGMFPSDEVQKERLQLQPVLSLHSRVAFLKTLPKGRYISYGATYTLEEEEVIATIPVGYGDGYPRSLSNQGFVLIHGQRAPIRGRICMDQFMVDVTHIPNVKIGDPVTLIGTEGEETLSMDELAGLSGRINYEFACDLGKRIPRVFVRENEILETRDYFG